MFYIYHGEDDFSRREALNRLKAGLGPAETLMTTTTLLDGAELTLEHLAAVCNTIPFLAEHRLVVVEGLLSRWGMRERRGRTRAPSQRQSSSDLGDWAAAPETLRAMPSTTVLVLIDGPLNRENPLLKLLAPLGEVVEFIPLRGAKLQQWIQSKVTGSGGAISPSAARLLAQYAGGSLWALASEIEKLCIYAEGRPITDEDIDNLVAGARESNIFALVDAVVEGKASRACQELTQLVNAGASAAYILVMLARQFRLLILSKELEGKGVPMRDIGKRLGISSEYALGKVIDQAAPYHPEELRRAYEMILSTDLAIKTGELSERLALEVLGVELAEERSRRRRQEGTPAINV